MFRYTVSQACILHVGPGSGFVLCSLSTCHVLLFFSLSCGALRLLCAQMTGTDLSWCIASTEGLRQVVLWGVSDGDKIGH